MELHSTVRTALAAAVTTAIGTTGRARFYTAALATLLAEADCNNPAFTPGAAGVENLDVTPAVEDTGPVAAGTCTRLGFYSDSTVTASNFEIMLGVATGGSPDVTMANNVIATTDTVQIASLSFTVPAGTPDDS